MKLFSALLLASAFTGSFAFAYPYPGFLCHDGYHSDSYGRGVEAGFKGAENLRPAFVDEGCYQLGVRRGQSLRTEPLISDCDGDFESGYSKGFSVSELSAGSACYSGGYDAGRALLDVGAREGNTDLVGSACVEAYEKGVADIKSHQIAALPTTDEPIASCYRLGCYDGDFAN